MQAILSAQAIKPFTKALAALSKYGEDLDIFASSEHLSLSATNSSKSAYGRFKLAPEFFEKYRLNAKTFGSEFRPAALDDDLGIAPEELVSGQIVIKSVLSILKIRGVEKNVERCEIAIVPGGGIDQQAEPPATGTTTSSMAADANSSILVIRFHCKYGVKKTHRLSLSAPPALLAPQLPDSPDQSKVIVGPKAIKDLVDHFSAAKGKTGKAGELQLIWEWGGDDVRVRSAKGFLSGPSDAQISTSITVDAEEFDHYEIPAPPVCMSFHLREFLAAVSLAEAVSLQLIISFTQALEPVSITISSDAHESIFVLATKQVATSALPTASAAPGQKRTRPESPQKEPLRKKPFKVVAEVPLGHMSTNVSKSRVPSSSLTFKTPEVPVRRPTQTSGAGPSGLAAAPSASLRSSGSRPPLFHPSSQAPASQRPFDSMSQADQEMLRASGLGIEHMTEDEINAMLDYDDDLNEIENGPRKLAPSRPPNPRPPVSADFRSLDDRADSAFDEPDPMVQMEIDADPDANEPEYDELDESLLPMTQMSERIRAGPHRKFEVLDFDED